MEIQKHLNKMKEIQDNIISYLDSNQFDEENTKNLFDFFSDIKIQKERDEFKSLLYSISKISNNHHQTQYFFEKIFGIINYYSTSIKSNFSNLEIFNIFKESKQIILFLIENKILEVDRTNSSFIRELRRQSILGPSPIPHICQLIQNDNIDDFIKYTSQSNYPIKSAKIKVKIFETNSFLIDKNPTLIEYSAFCGSIQIFKYLHSMTVNLTSSLWIYAIHGSSNEIIKILEENQILPNYECLIESIKCFHNKLAVHLFDNYITNKNTFFRNYSHQIFESNNFNFINSEQINESSIYDLYLNHYSHIIKLLSKDKNVDINFINSKESLNGFKVLIEQKSLLHLATENKDIETIKILLENENFNADVFSNYIIKYEKHFKCTRKTALHLAVENNCIEIVNILLERSKSCGNTYSFFNTLITEFYCFENAICEKNALYIAYEKKYMDILNLLLEKSFIDVNAKYYDYCSFQNGMEEKETTLLNIAISCNYIEMVNILLSKPDINVNIEYFFKEECSTRPFVFERYYKIL